MSQPKRNKLSKKQRAKLLGTRLSLLFAFLLTLAVFSLNISSFVRLAAASFPVSRELWFLGLSSAMFLSILILILRLLIRVSRELQLYELRANFFSGVSHELKTPLSVIQLYSETLADGDEELSAEERHNYMRIIARESRRLSYLITNILDFAKIEAGTWNHDLRFGNLGVIVGQTVADYSEYCSQNGFAIKTEIPLSLPRTRFDRSVIAQIIVNLLDNAIKYSDKSKSITVRMWSKDNEVALEVEDQGIGIPASEQAKIFEPFYQIADRKSKGGTGLGLYLVRHVMDGLGGRIDLTSVVGKGSKFTLFFPVSFQPAEDVLSVIDSMQKPQLGRESS
jgi:two-component system, OmpR family, phosphate regulon sensor histidine kinase PhoR